MPQGMPQKDAAKDAANNKIWDKPLWGDVAHRCQHRLRHFGSSPGDGGRNCARLGCLAGGTRTWGREREAANAHVCKPCITWLPYSPREIPVRTNQGGLWTCVFAMFMNTI